MNILAFKDIENYLSNRQVYVGKEFCNSDLKTIMPANKVVDMGRVVGDCIAPDKYVLEYEVNRENHNHIVYGSQYAFFAFIKQNLIPVKVLVENYQNS